MVSNFGRLVRFDETKVRASGRASMGVRGIRLGEDQSVISMIRLEHENYESTALMVSADGFGKRTDMSQFARKGRGGAGVMVLPANKRGQTEMISALLVEDGDEVMLITDAGTLIRTEVSGISKLSRIAAGVTLIKMHEDQTLVGVATVRDGDASSSDDEEANEVVEAADSDGPR